MTSKITVQAMKGDNKSSMGLSSVEYIHALPKCIIDCPDNWVKTEPNTVFYTRVSGNKKTYSVMAYNYRENEKVVSLEMWVK